MTITPESCMKTDACMHRESGWHKSHFCVSHTAAKQHLLQAKYETEKPAWQNNLTIHLFIKISKSFEEENKKGT